MDSYVAAAFHQLCAAAERPTRHFVVLMERAPYYGGPEEGGWWGEDHIVCAYQEFTSAEAAETVKSQVEALAQELTKTAERRHGDQCLRETEWLDARGLDDNYLPEPDGASAYYVIVADAVPENSYGTRYYE